jgi:hypothetical protein
MSAEITTNRLQEYGRIEYGGLPVKYCDIANHIAAQYHSTPLPTPRD